MNLVIRKSGKNFFVFDKDKNKKFSIDYEDEKYCLRAIKLATRYKYDWQTMPVVREYGGSDTVPKDMPDITPEPVEPEEKIPWDETYQCSQCNKVHFKTSKIGRDHLKYRAGGNV